MADITNKRNSPYNPEEAKIEIDRLLSGFGGKCVIRFAEDACEISNSWLVHSKKLRHTICRIIADSGVTRRSYENLSAEWLFHNLAYRLHIFRASARDVTLDYTHDTRKIVVLITNLFDLLNWE